MKKKAELLQKIVAARKNVMALLHDGKMDEAKTASDELDKMVKDYVGMPDDEPAGRSAVNMNKDKGAIKRAVNSFLHKGWKGLDDAERQLLKPINATDTPGQVGTIAERGGVFVPVETADFAETMETGVYRLRTRVSEYFARSLSGKIPLVNNPTAGLVQLFDELPEGGIPKGQVTFGVVNWQAKDYGLIIPVSNDLMADAEADVMGIIGEQFFRAQVITENNMILAAIDGNGDAEAVDGWKGIAEALNGTAPIGSPDKVVVTNTDGYNYLDTLTDEMGRPILTQALVDNPRRIFRGYEVIQLPNEILATSGTAIPFYVGSLRDAVVFVERKGLEISYNPWSDSAYGKNAVDVRVTCRMDCKTKFATAVKKLTVTPA